MQFKVNEALKIFKGKEERLRYFGQEPVWRCCVLILNRRNGGGKNLYFWLLMSRNAHGMSRFLVSRFGDCTRRKRLSVMNMQTFVLHHPKPDSVGGLPNINQCAFVRLQQLHTVQRLRPATLWTRIKMFMNLLSEVRTQMNTNQIRTACEGGTSGWHWSLREVTQVTINGSISHYRNLCCVLTRLKRVEFMFSLF